MRYVVGIDGGGTKTTAALVGEDLTALAKATTGPSNHRSVGIEAASENITEAIRQVLRAANVSLEDVLAICTCLAGFDTELDLPVPRQALEQLEYTGAAILENDVVGAWAGATEAQAGLVMIAGTGATGLGMNPRGELWRTDGWDYILGDAGSGYAIGYAAIRACMQMLDGRRPPTSLMRLLGAVYNVEDAEAMRRLVDSTHFGKLEIASFAQPVAEAAQEGDPVARQILGEAGREHGASAVAIIRMLGMQEDEFPVATVGGVFNSGPWVRQPFEAAVLAEAPHAHFRAPVHPPEIGAAILALRRAKDGDSGSWTLGTGRRRIRRSLRVDGTLPA